MIYPNTKFLFIFEPVIPNKLYASKIQGQDKCRIDIPISKKEKTRGKNEKVMRSKLVQSLAKQASYIKAQE